MAKPVTESRRNRIQKSSLTRQFPSSRSQILRQLGLVYTEVWGGLSSSPLFINLTPTPSLFHAMRKLITLPHPSGTERCGIRQSFSGGDAVGKWSIYKVQIHLPPTGWKHKFKLNTEESISTLISEDSHIYTRVQTQAHTFSLDGYAPWGLSVTALCHPKCGPRTTTRGTSV